MDKPSRPKSHVVGDVGQTAVSLLLKTWGWTADIIHSDYGEDIECNVFVEGQRTNLYFRSQVKSTDSAEDIDELEDGQLKVSIKSTTCRQWLEEFFPVFIVVYDVKRNCGYWCDPLVQLRADYSVLNQQKVSFTVVRVNDLSASKKQITDKVEAFYARLVKLDKLCLSCEVFPVLMPGYRSEPSGRPFLNRAIPNSPLRVERCSRNFNYLPSWMTRLKALQPDFVNGVELESDGQDVTSFIKSVRDFIVHSSHDPGQGKWFSFVLGPISLRSKEQKSAHQTLFTGELTDWQSVSRLGTKLVNDHEYAFTAPTGFIKQIGMRSETWDGYFYAHRELDLAMQLLAGVTSTPNNYLRAELFKGHIDAQILPWECPTQEVKALEEEMTKVDLAFRQIPDTPTSAGVAAGVITMPMTNPHLGVLHMALDWHDLEQGIELDLKAKGLFDRLPGRKAGDDLKSIVENLFARISAKPPDEVFITGPEHIRGIPLNLKSRIIEISRFRKGSAVDPSLIDCSVVQQKLSQDLGGIANVKSFLCESFPGFLSKINRYVLRVEPPLEMSSSDCFDQIKEQALAMFESLEPRKNQSEDDTFSTLNNDGQVYFEGDEKYLVY